jgi:hypothetical protein
MAGVTDGPLASIVAGRPEMKTQRALGHGATEKVRLRTFLAMFLA